LIDKNLIQDSNEREGEWIFYIFEKRGGEDKECGLKPDAFAKLEDKRMATVNKEP
jgi:hypothetical protein